MALVQVRNNVGNNSGYFNFDTDSNSGDDLLHPFTQFEAYKAGLDIKSLSMGSGELLSPDLKAKYAAGSLSGSVPATSGLSSLQASPLRTPMGMNMRVAGMSMPNGSPAFGFQDKTMAFGGLAAGGNLSSRFIR